MASQDGDYILAGIFNIGTMETVNGTRGCSYTDPNFYSLQRALTFRDTVLKASSEFTTRTNATLGYLIYDGCLDLPTTGVAAVEIARNNKVVGAGAPDRANLTKYAASTLTSFSVPTFASVFFDSELQTLADFPTLFSMMDTEVDEGKLVLHLLDYFGYQFVDIWYHSYSEENALYVYEKHTEKGQGYCARITLLTGAAHAAQEIEEVYAESNDTTESNETTSHHAHEAAADVQIILDNSVTQAKVTLTYMVNELGFRNKIFIFGTSMSRYEYEESLRSIVGSTNTLLFTAHALLNAQIPELNEVLSAPWNETGELLDQYYMQAQGSKCSDTVCPVSSWIPFFKIGGQIIIDRLTEGIETQTLDCPEALREFIYSEVVCTVQNISVELDENVTLHGKIENRVVQFGYDIFIYRPNGTSGSAGKVTPENLDISNPGLLSGLTHRKMCSDNCTPGLYRLFEGEYVAKLPCCWECVDCAANTYSMEINAPQCIRCEDNESSNGNNTSCVMVELEYIALHNSYLIGAIFSFFVGEALAVTFGIIIYRNESRPVIKASDVGYLYNILVSLMLGFMTSMVPMLPPTSTICSLEYTMFLVFTTMTTTNLAWKCWKIYGIFSSSDNFDTPKCSFLFKKKGQLSINIFNQITVLFFVFLNLAIFGPGWVYIKYQATPHDVINPICTVSTDTAAMVTALIPVSLPTFLLLFSLVMAFRMRLFPHNFKETLNIFAATLIVVLCCIMFLTGYTLSDPFFRALLRAIVMFLASLAFLLAIFLPRIAVLMNDADEQICAAQPLDIGISLGDIGGNIGYAPIIAYIAQRGNFITKRKYNFEREQPRF
eukprot:sb/3462080/